MTIGLLLRMRTALLLLSGLSFVGTMAQGSRGNCSITLLSDSSILQQVWCLDPPIATIEPIVFLVEGTGVQVTNLPPGLAADLSNDTLTISGTISTQGLNNLQVTTSEGCSSAWFYLDMSVIVDPGFACSIEGEDVILRWPGVNAPLEDSGEIILLCTTTDGFVGTQALFLPCPDSLVWTGLPTNTDLTFGMTGTGYPYCFPGYFETTCTITSTDVSERVEGDPMVRAVLHDDLLQLSASSELREVRIYDMVGALVASRVLNTHTASVPIASLAPGSFILRAVAADGRVSAQRFTKAQ